MSSLPLLLPFPLEILELVISFVAQDDPDKDTLLQCCKCSKSLLSIAQPLLFSTIRLWLLSSVNNSSSAGNLSQFLHVVGTSDLGKHVECLSIEGYALQSPILAAILENLPSIRVLRLSSADTPRPVIWDMIPPPTQEALLTFIFPNVREVWLETLSYWPFLTFGLACPRLDNLYFHQTGVKEAIDDFVSREMVAEWERESGGKGLSILEIMNVSHANVRPSSSFFKFLEHTRCAVRILSLGKSHDFSILATLEALLPLIGHSLKELRLDSEFVYMLIYRWNDAWPHRVDLTTGLFDFSSIPALSRLSLDVPIYGTRQTLLTLTPFFSVLADMIGSPSSPHTSLQHIIINIPTMEGVNVKTYVNEEDETHVQQWRRLDFLLSDSEKLPGFEAMVFNFSPGIGDVEGHLKFLEDAFTRCEMMGKLAFSGRQGWAPPVVSSNS
ncbi:hypothetical protein DL96DRAFT_364916 [Flagelloscypha sp. PMI_526]|nr:hypothetical protein DL96DRAFT_364916 [Flagelloscypha sp. PMI_526]